MTQRRPSNMPRGPSTRNRIIGVGLVAALSVASFAGLAQTAFDFEDPLDSVRQQIESKSAAPVATPTTPDQTKGWSASTTDASGAAVSPASSTPSTAATAPTTGASPLSAGLLALAALGVALLGLGLWWALRRRRTDDREPRIDRELYATPKGARGRRVLESGARVTRRRHRVLDTSEGKDDEAATAAAAAAAILSDDTLDAYEDDYEAEFDSGEPLAEVSTNEPVTVDARDPSTWKRPNLDRLKASIRDDWKGEDPAAAEHKREAEAFAELFGGDPGAGPAMPKPAKAGSPVLDMLDGFEGTETHDEMPLSALRAAVESHASHVQEDLSRPGAAPRPALPSRSDAVRRIKALREAVKAG